ncbi:MAG: helix-turn-helix domain-containing protein [Oscillospiraceae bacterium]
MSNRMFQGVIYQMKDAIGRIVGVTDEMGVIIACSELGQIDSMKDGVQAERMANSQSFVRGGYTFKGFSSNKRNDFYVFVEGTDDMADKFAAMLAIAAQSLKQFHDEKFDRLNFIKNVVMDNIMPGDIYAKAREMHFATDIPRVVLIIRVSQQKDMSTFDVVQNLFPDKQKDFVFNTSETDTVLIKELKKGIETKDIEKLAASIVDTLNVEYYIKSTIGIGTQIVNIKDLANSFKEAQIALEVGKVFDTERTIVNYEHLGVARLIYQLPTTLCEMFLKEVFKQGSIESLDQETLFTIQSFFENNLNVSETSRGLFVHRNTLVYRLEKIRKITGLDLREFDDAIVFKVALMVKKYLQSSQDRF